MKQASSVSLQADTLWGQEQPELRPLGNKEHNSAHMRPPSCQRAMLGHSHDLGNLHHISSTARS